MINFTTWISKFRVPKGSHYTHVGMDKFKGRFYIPSDKINAFIKYYHNHVFDKKLPCDLIEKHDSISCLLFDLDFKLPEDSTERGYTQEQITEFISKVIDIVSQYIEVPYRNYDAFVFEKDSTTKRDGFRKDGVHIVFPYLVTEIATQYFIRDSLLVDTKELLETELSPIEDIIDESVIEKNGWMMYGSKKTNGSVYTLTGIWVQKSDDTIGMSLPSRLEHSSYYEPSVDLINLLSIRNFTVADIVQYREETQDIIESFIDEFNSNRLKNNEPSTKKYNGVVSRDIDLNIVRDLVNILSVKRSDSYQSWIEVGWCLHNISDTLLDLWISFSEKSEKYSENASVSCNTYWRQMNRTGLSLGTLHMWAKMDNITAYFDILKGDEEYLIYQTIKDALYSKGETKKMPDLNIVYEVVLILKYKYGNDYICSSFDNKTWYEFNGNRWLEGDKDVSLRKIVREDLHALFQKVSKKYKDISKNLDKSHPNKDKYLKTSNEIHKVAQKFRNQKFRDQVMKESTEHLYWDSSRSCQFKSSKFPEILDNNSNLVGMKNGTYDLNLGIFRESRSDDYISLSTEIDYKEYTWTDPIIDEIRLFIEKILPCFDVREYVMRVLASFLDGETVHEHFHFWVGSGGNGKSKLIELFESAFGSYCAKLSIAALTTKRAGSSAPTPEIARLVGKRFVVLQEPNEHETLQVGIMKELTGGDKIVARSLHKEAIEFKPQFKMILTCNQLPKLPADDGGTWRRVKLVEFKSAFKENPNPTSPNEFHLDPHLSDKMKNWSQGFFWMLTQYYAIYKKDGYTEPDEIRGYTRQYQQSLDMHADFINEKIIEEENKFLLVDDMYSEFKDWYSRTIGSKVPSNKGIKTYIEKKYGKMSYKEHKKGWHGIALRSQLNDDLIFDDNECAHDIMAASL